MIKKVNLFLLVLLILLAGFLRFYRIDKLDFFTYDQARDAIFVKRIIVDHKFRLLGTQTSMPGMFLPPFYYYTIAPFLFLFKLNPVGIDFYSALIGVLTVPLMYFVANKIFGSPAGLFSAALAAVSQLLVELTRRAWNPNTLPFFILIVFYFLYRYFNDNKGKLKNLFLAFAFYGYCLSLHFGAWTLLPLFLFVSFYHLFNNSKRNLGGFIGSLGILLFSVSPLLIFEVRHQFFLSSQAFGYFIGGKHLSINLLNLSESFLSSIVALFAVLFSGQIRVGHGSPLEFSGKFSDLFGLKYPISVIAQRPFSINFAWWGVLLLGLIILVSFFAIRKAIKNEELKGESLALAMIWAWLIWGIFVSRLYSGGFFFFYYLYLFPIPFLLFGFLIKKIYNFKKIRVALYVLLLILMYFSVRKSTVFISTWRDINDLKEISQIIAENISANEVFNIATIRRDNDFWERNSVDYRYFTETYWNKKALDWYPLDYEQAKYLFVVDETGNSDILNSKVMEITIFNPDKIIGFWKAEKGVIIYKLAKKIAN